MRLVALPLALVLPLLACGGCGGGGGSTPAAPTPLTTEQLLEQCVASDLGDLTTLLGTIQGLLDPASGGPQPEFDLIAGLLTGVLPWTIDLDADQVDDVSGTIFLTDATGGVTLPPELATLLGGSGIDLDQVLGLLPDGTSVHLTFGFDDPLPVSGASGDGELVVAVSGGTPTGVSGGGTFASGPCGFEFDFDGLGPELPDGIGFGTGSVGFEVTVGPDSVTGSVALDGTNTARVTARRNGGPEEVFLVDLTTGDVTPA